MKQHPPRRERRSFRRGQRLGLAGLLFYGAVACGVPGARDGESAQTEPVYDAATLYSSVSLRGLSFAADESRLLFSSDASGVFNVYQIGWEGGEPQRLTDSKEQAVLAVSFFPHDDRFLYSADQGGNELDHLYVQAPDGAVRDLTPGERLKAGFMDWSADKRHFWVQTNERDARYFDVYRYDTETLERELVFENGGGFLLGGMSPDGRSLALVKRHDNSDSDLHIYDVASGGVRHITPHEGAVSHGVATFTADSKELYYTTDGEGEFTQVWSYDLESGARRPVVQADWDVVYTSFSDSGRYRVSAVNADATTQVSILDTESGEDLPLPPLPDGDVGPVRFSPSESRVALYVTGDTAPADLYVFELAEGKTRQLTRSLAPAIDPDTLVEGEVVRYASFDGLEIPAVLYRPHGASPGNRVPALVLVHGGPGGQNRKGYRPDVQHLVNHGYAVLAVNNRGSSGYGKTFFHMDDKRHGDVDLKDCVWGRRYLESLDWVDGDKVGIMGGSYGGYMVAAALAFEPEAFDVGIDIFGVTNWVRTLRSIPSWWVANRSSLYSELGDPFVEEERLQSISPLFHAANIVRPLLVVQGSNDPRVLQVESDELVAAVRANGVPVEYVVFPDEGHGFRGRANRIAASEAYLRFLNEHLRGSET